jgi:hypothetical protein
LLAGTACWCSYRAVHHRACTAQNVGLQPPKYRLQALPRNQRQHPNLSQPGPNRKPQRRAERTSPMESNHVGVSSSASFWAADLHRRVCEWEVITRLPPIICRSELTLIVCLDVIPTSPLMPTNFITTPTTVRCHLLCRYRRMAMRTASLRTRRTAAVGLSQVSALLISSPSSLPFHAASGFKCIVPLESFIPCMWSQIPYH